MDRQALSRSDWLTVPNIITVVRLLLLLPICYLFTVDGDPVLSAVLLVVFGATDWCDGFIARRFNQVSRVGEVIDPIADRLGVALIAVFLVVGQHIPSWIGWVIVLTDLTLAFIFLIFRGKYRPGVSHLGKVRTAILMTGLPLIVFGRIEGLGFLGSIGMTAVSAGALLHAIVGCTYAWAMISSRSEQK